MGGGRARETEKGRDGDGDWGLSRSGQPGPAGQPAGGHLPPRRWPPWRRLAPAARHSGRMKMAKTVMFISRLTRDDSRLPVQMQRHRGVLGHSREKNIGASDLRQLSLSE